MPQSAAVGSPATKRVEDEFLLGGPAPVDAGLAGARPGSNAFDAERGVADLGQLGEGGLTDGVLERGPALALRDAASQLSSWRSR